MHKLWAWIALLGFASILGSAIAFFAIGTSHDWGAGQYGALSAWVFGVATFVGVGVSLIQAAQARAETERQNWLIERRRRVDLEIARRTRGMESCKEILELVIENHIEFVETIRRARQNTADRQLRHQLSLDHSLRWAKMHAKLGVLVMPIATSKFAHELADILPVLNQFYTDIDIPEAPDDELVGYIDRQDRLMDGTSDELLAAVHDEFPLDMDKIVALVNEDWPAP